MAEVQGYCDSKFNPVREILQQRIASGDELGASLCINVDGKTVLDLWGGHMNVAQTKEWTEDTITGVWSSTKLVTCLAVQILASRGLIDVDEKVAAYWPEFAANGKENAKVSHILSHTSGVPAWDGLISAEEIQDTKKATDRLADQAPWWVPGEQHGYHLISWGHMMGELVRRISGKSLTQFISDEIATPLGADFRLGLPEQDYSRTADIVPPPPVSLDGIDAASLVVRAMVGSAMDPTLPNQTGFRKSEIGAANGFSNARALARIGSVISLDGVVDGKKYLSSGTLDKMMEEQAKGLDPALLLYTRYGLGVGLPSLQTLPCIPEDDHICFWGGWGGSLLIMDRGRRMTIAYVMNKMSARPLGNESVDLYAKEIYKILGAL
ncbi:beta-lactamase [Penicillium cinerascens]|uniref:Beta-lactamase n=1 Tax=Penicillium cinerascens TaxID=70096 RepID=A0A9W9SZH4_9EURO|nr:beta-lactamase [Penicillium cinerascens]KAJ5203839.1 beta-lactamase [Penicillium cinerascens]